LGINTEDLQVRNAGVNDLVPSPLGDPALATEGNSQTSVLTDDYG